MDNRERVAKVLKSVSKKPALPDADESLFDSGFCIRSIYLTW